jgi:prepilin-type N-terminal cleavage/methylation domain-containing protein
MRKPRGFTLVEMATAALVLATLSALAVAGMRGIRQRGSFASATGDVIGGLRLARAEASGRGQAVYYIIDTNVATDAIGNVTEPRWWVLLDIGGDFNFTAWDPNNPMGLGDKVLSSGIFPSGVTISAPSGYPQALPAPYQLIPVAGSSIPATPAYCSFCLTTGPLTNYGWVRFAPGASPSATFSGTNTSAFGQQLTVYTNSSSKNLMMVVAILARSGAIYSTPQAL